MKYFTISDMLRSDTAIKQKIWNGANLEVEENLRFLIEQVLDPLQEKYKKPIHVTSGYRCPYLNRILGGSINSQHMSGEAADITTGNPDENFKLGQMIEALGKFDQLIYEDCDKGKPKWIHVSCRRHGLNRKMILYK